MPNRTSEKPKGQAAVPFWKLLQSIFPDVQCERRFPWLTLPSANEASSIEAEVRATLIVHCRTTQTTQQHPKKRQCSPELLAQQLNAPPRPKLEFDFFVPSLNLAFEFDERQHFTEERAVSLECYRGLVQTAFDATKWIQKCSETRAVDADPIWRDWQRAWRDAVRDIRAAEYGVRLGRYAYDDPPTAEAILNWVATTSRSAFKPHTPTPESPPPPMK